MTALYLVQDEQGDFAVLRVLQPEYARDARIRKRFIKAAEIMQELYPVVPQLIEAGRQSGTYYMIMRYIPGRNLRQLILQRDPRLNDSPLPIILNIASAIAQIHQRGYLHMDIKPENIMLPDGSSQVYLIDCDLAVKYSGSPVKLAAKPGTPGYLAPEVVATGVADERSDIFSFGVTAYEALTFHKPFEAERREEMLRRELDAAEPPTPISRYRKDVSRPLERILAKCLAKEPAQRYPSMSLVVRDIQNLINV